MSAAAILQQFLDAGPDQARAGYAAVAVTFIDRPTFSSGAFPADPVLVLGCAGGPVWDPSRRIARPAVPRSGRHRPHLQTHQLRRGADRHPLRGRDQRTSYRPEGDNGSPLSQRSRRQDAPRPPRPRRSRKIRRREQLRLRCRARGRAGWSSGHGRAQINASQAAIVPPHLRRRGTGILNNELYIGRLVWNRLRYIKDPEAGKRVSRLNPESEWIVQDAAALRIIDQALWDRIKSRQRVLEANLRPGWRGEAAAVEHLADEMLDHFLRYLEIGDDAIAQRPDCLNVSDREPWESLAFSKRRARLTIQVLRAAIDDAWRIRSLEQARAG